MKIDVESIKRSKNIFIFADKTNNIYETDVRHYNKLQTIFLKLTRNQIQLYLAQ